VIMNLGSRLKKLFRVASSRYLTGIKIGH